MLFLDDDETDNPTDLASFQQQNVAYVEIYLVGVTLGEVQNLPLLFARLSLAVDIVEKRLFCVALLRPAIYSFTYLF